MNFLEARWGLQLIAEEGVGRRLAELAADEDMAMSRAQQELGG